ncbi:N-acetylmuramoyl-L-alanine amidase, partial [Aetokthonos hydrillicola]
MKFGIDIGHNCPPDTGVTGIKQEDVLTLDVGTQVISKLKALGHEVVECTPSQANTVRESLSKRCDTANNAKVDLYLSIHFNGFNRQANGTEVYAISDKATRIAKPVLDEIVKLGFFNRGIKSGTHLFVLRNTEMPAILVECCFCDAPKDMNILNTEAIANAIVKGLTGQLPTNSASFMKDEEQNVDTTVLRLQKALNRLKITDKKNKPLVEDNVLGVATSSAIQKFQEIAGIEQTRIIDEATWKAINLILAKRMIRVNHAGGPVVRYLQYRLGVEINGLYTPQMEVMVKKFQLQNGLIT